LILSALKISMALTAGNTLVLKPSVEAPLTAVKLVECCSRHLPPGALNLVTGTGEECGRPLLEHPGIAKLSFTGSTEVGRAVMQAGAERIIPVSLELGGKNPQIVFPDADTEHTVQQVINAMRFIRQGQSCTAGSRLFLHASIFDDFLARLCETLKGLRIGDPFDESTQVGAMVNRTQFEKVCAYIREGLEQPGAQILCGGLPPESGPLAQGYFLQPTLFSGVAKHWRLAREEVFGPVLTAHPWTTEEEVIAMANDSHFGLSAFIYSRDINTALKTAHALESGFVQINQGAGIVPGQSYGGFKQSGIGREWSLEGMLESFTQRKSVTVNLA
jgi:betaine-aldehyde dehydrogenase